MATGITKFGMALGAMLGAAVLTEASSAQDFDAMCLMMTVAAGEGAAAAEAAALEAAQQSQLLDPRQLQTACRAIACGLRDAPADVADAIVAGVIRAGNEELAACVANFTTLQPAAIIPPPAIDGSPS